MPRKNVFNKRDTGPLPIVRITFCVCMALATLSLFTPYPARLIEAWKGTAATGPEDKGVVHQEVEPPATRAETPIAKPPHPAPPVPAPPVVPVAPPPQGNLVDAGTITPWTLESTFTLPKVQYPPFPPVLPTKPSTGALWNITELARGLNLKTEVVFKEGGLASNDRKVNANYRATFKMEVALPKPLTKVDQLVKLNRNINRMLPGLNDLFQSARVSKYYTQMYARKQNEIRKNMTSLNKVLDRHNFYDTETILEIKHPKTNRKVLWLQSEMDVVSDGSDGDRLATMPDNILKSNFYQPSTSYRWRKKTDRKNPLLTAWENRLKDAKTDLLKAKAADRTAINNRIDYAERVITELKNYSFLIAEYDPFIVVPLGIVNQSGAYSPSFGDYVVVVVGDKLYPAIVGDAGPRYKTGEASLRLAKTVNPNAGIYSRPVSDLLVSYIIFPGTAETEKGPPDYEQWEKRCRELLDEIGGLGEGYSLHKWEDLLTPKPPPAPEPLPGHTQPAAPSLPPDNKPPLVPVTPPLTSGASSGQTSLP